MRSPLAAERERVTTLFFYCVLLLLGYLLFRIFAPFLGPLGWAAVLAIGAGLATLMALQVARLRQVLATCDACPYRRDWEACPGVVGAGPALAGGPTSLLETARR